MTGFKYFQKIVREKGGIWSTDDVYFSQFKDSYQAAYLPGYPEKTPLDQVINCPLFKQEES